MKRIHIFILLLTALLILSGCAVQEPVATQAPAAAVTEAPTRMPTEPSAETPTEAPQPVPVEITMENWEEYFLLKAVNTWHTAQALVMQGDADGLPLEERYQPNLDWHAEYMTGEEPAIEFLYGWNPGYRVNTLHQEYIDAMPDLLDDLAAELGYPSSEDMAAGVFGTTEEAVLSVASLYNRGYSYYTALTYLLGTEYDTTVEKEAEESEDTAEVTPTPAPAATPAPTETPEPKYDGTPRHRQPRSLRWNTMWRPTAR